MREQGNLNPVIIPFCFIEKIRCEYNSYFEYDYIKPVINYLNLVNINFTNNIKVVIAHRCNSIIFDTYDQGLNCIYNNLFQKSYYTEIRDLFLVPEKRYDSKSLKIPSIYHVCWISNPSKPNSFPIALQENLQSIYNRTRGTFYLWSNLDHNLLSIKKSFSFLNVRDIQELTSYNKFSSLFNEYLRNNIPVGVADITKLMALKDYGGMGIDGDFLFHNNPIILNTVLDFYAGAHTLQTIGGGYIASKQNHTIISKSLDIIAGNYGLDSSSYEHAYMPKIVSCHGLIEYTMQGSLDLAYYLENNKNGNIDLLLDSSYLHELNKNPSLSIEIDGALLLFNNPISRQYYTSSWRKNCTDEDIIIVEYANSLKINRVSQISTNPLVSKLLENYRSFLHENSVDAEAIENLNIEFQDNKMSDHYHNDVQSFTENIDYVSLNEEVPSYIEDNL
jgi:hypothetical protein